MPNKSLVAASVLMVLVLAGAGCGKKEPVNTAPAAEGQQQNVQTERQPGQIAYDFPVQAATTAKAGEYVLAVPRTWVDQSFEDPSDAVFIYYAAKMVTPDANESEIETLSGEKMSVPNSLIIPIPKGATAKKGDMLLTWWQSGSGMSRAIVVGGTPTEPEVLYLDREYNPDDAPETLMPDSFVNLTSPDQAGATVACKADGEQSFTRYQLVNTVNGKVLLLGWAGKVAAMNKANCATLPIVPTVKAGDSAYFPSYGTFTAGTVTKVDPAIGRVTMKYTFAGQEQEEVVPFGDVTTQFVR